MNIYERLDEFIIGCHNDGFDVGVKLETATECCWSCELRLTIHPNDMDGPDESRVFYATGGADPEEVIERCLEAVEAYLQDTGGL